ncbi:MAG: hypothetical protein SGILL_002322 [Bacillariaceae sp.]
MPDFQDRAEEAVPNPDIFVFSASSDGEQAFEIDHEEAFELPDPQGKSGGACTSALLQTLWQDEPPAEGAAYSWSDTLELMREKIDEMGLDQTPQLSSSRPIAIMEEECCIVPPDCHGTKRALLVGVNYVGQDAALSSCHQDIRNMKDFLIQVQGFERENMLIVMDDGNHHEPDKEFIMKCLRQLCAISEPGDCIFFQFSGHGGQLRDANGDEMDGKDEIFFPGDYQEAGHITDDEIYAEFVSQIQPGVHVFAMMDCCHSGTVMDLPYVCGVGEEGFHENDYFKPAMAGGAGVAVAAAAASAGKKKKKKGDKDKKKKKKKDSSSDKKDSDSTGKKKKSKNGTKKKKKKDAEEEPASTADEDEEGEMLQSVEPKKKKGLFGFGRKK